LASQSSPATTTTVAEEVSKVDEGKDGDGDWGPVMLANWDDARRQNASFFSLSSTLSFIYSTFLSRPTSLLTKPFNSSTPRIVLAHACLII
jgi:hypothetical protein